MTGQEPQGIPLFVKIKTLIHDNTEMAASVDQDIAELSETSTLLMVSAGLGIHCSLSCGHV